MPDLADVVVVGGGILGCALTWEFARRSLRVVLLDAGEIASGTTRSSFAWVNGTSKTDDEAYHRLNAQGMASWANMTAQWGGEAVGWHGGGSLYWVQGAAEQERLRQQYARLQAWSYPVVWVQQDEIAALEPNAANVGGAQGLFAPADGWVETGQCCRFLLAQARQHSADIRPHCPATGFTRSITDAISTVETPQGRIATRILVLAAGTHTGQLAGWAGGKSGAQSCPVREVPGLLVELPSVPVAARVGRVCYPPDAHGLHLRPTLEGGLLLGANDTDALLQSAPPDEISEEAVRSLLHRAANALPALKAAGIASFLPRRCVRPVPADDRPIVGELPGVHHVHAAVTHSGVTLAPLLANLLAEEIVTGRLSPLLQPYRPARFATLRQPVR